MFGTLYYFHIKESQKLDPAFNLTYIDQEGGLPTSYLLELMELSKDLPLNLHEFSLKEIEVKLCSSPFIKNTVVTRLFPNLCSLSYTMRKPVARLSDWENGGLDEEGVLIPIDPFFDAGSLPVVTLGEVGNAKWGKKIISPRRALALELIKNLSFNGIDRIDVSRTELPSFGSREIIVVLENKIIRLNPDHWKEGWLNFLQMESILPKGEKSIVDLRIKDLAFINSNI